MEQFKICENCNFSGVYAILNTENNKIYIGSSRNIRKRLKSHKTSLENGKSNIVEMQKDFENGNKFIAFVVTPVALCSQSGKECNNLRHFEEKAISMFYSYCPNIGYNKIGTCAQLAEVLNIMDSRKLVEDSNFGYLMDTERRF